MLDARVFFLAAVFNIRTSAVDHGRRFDFLAILRIYLTAHLGSDPVHQDASHSKSDLPAENAGRANNRIKHKRAMGDVRQEARILMVGATFTSYDAVPLGIVQAPQKRTNADRIAYQPRQVNPFDSIRPEHALVEM
jgi:hypothetical protein